MHPTNRVEASVTPTPDSESRDRSPTVQAAILLSRIAGFMRDRALSHFFGASVHADAWRAAMRLPNLLQNLLGEGTLNSSFTPVLSELQAKQQPEAARALAGAVLGLLLLAVGVVVLVGVVLAGPLVHILFPGFDEAQQARTASLVRLFFPMTGLLVLSAWTIGILNSHRHFFLPYVAPVLWNFAIIGGFVLAGWGMGWRGDPLLQFAGIAALVGGALQFGVQVPRVLRLTGGVPPSLSLQVDGVREVIRRFLPALAGRGAVNFGSYAEFFLASFLATGALATLGYAQTLYLLPISLFGMSVAIVQLPELAAARATEVPRSTIIHRLEGAIFRVSYFTVPSAAVYLVLGAPVVATVYQTGAFGAAEVQLTGLVLGAYALGVWPSAQSRLLNSGFQSRGNTRTPAWMALVRVFTAIGVGVALMLRLDEITLTSGLALGALGLALGSAVGGWVEWLLLHRLLARDLGTPIRWASRALGGVCFASALAVATGWGLGQAVLRGVLPSLHPILHGALVLVPTGGVYLGVTLAMGLASWRRGPQPRHPFGVI
jgi:putative peptidoglycan lipid II flippase